VLILARNYHPVADEDYLDSTAVGAMMGPEAIRKAMELGLLKRDAVFHVHSHGGRGVPAFSSIDRREHAKFVPDFLKVAPQNIHGALVLSDCAGAGVIWTAGARAPERISNFVEVGAPLRKWGMQ
jgi:hypothetical protein